MNIKQITNEEIEKNFESHRNAKVTKRVFLSYQFYIDNPNMTDLEILLINKFKPKKLETPLKTNCSYNFKYKDKSFNFQTQFGCYLMVSALDNLKDLIIIELVMDKIIKQFLKINIPGGEK